MYAIGTKHNTILDDLPVAVAKRVATANRAEMRDRHEKQRKAISAELSRVEAKMNSDAFTSDIRKRLSKIRTQLNKSPRKRKKSVRFAASVKKS